jgi:hypothetical protein
MLGMYNQYVKNSINNSDVDHKCVLCSATHSLKVRQLKHTIIFLIPLLLLFSQVAYATNESSYKWGYQQGKSEFANCDDFDADCTAAPDDCQSPANVSVKNETSGYYNSIPKYLLVDFCLIAQTTTTAAFATSQVSPQLAAEGVKIVVVKGVKCVDINGTLSDCDPAHGWSAVGNGTLVGISHPDVPPMPLLNITATRDKTIITTPPINANATSNEHDYKYGFKDGFNDYKSSSTESADLDFFVAPNDDVYDCQVVKNLGSWGGKTHTELTGITNSTACRDGYVAGWKSWCKSNGLDCAYWAASGIVPSLVAQAQKVNRCVPWSFCLDRQHLINGYEQELYDKGLALGHLGNHTGAK